MHLPRQWMHLCCASIATVSAAASACFREHSRLWSWFSHCCLCVLCSRFWAWNSRRQMMGWRCNLNPGTCSCWLLRLWKVTGSQLTLQAFMAVFWHLTACLDGSRLQHRARQGNEWIHWQIFSYISFLLTIVSFQTVLTRPSAICCWTDKSSTHPSLVI